MSQPTYDHVPVNPPTPLGVYRVLSPNASVHVSPLQLGGMSIGDQWDKAGMGAMNKESSIKLLDAFYEAGGNLIDTANIYQMESSESIIGEWMEMRGNREEMVIATKVTPCFCFCASRSEERIANLHFSFHSTRRTSRWAKTSRSTRTMPETAPKP